MKKMKMFKMFIMSLCMALILVACGDKNTMKEDKIKVTTLDYTLNNEFANYNIKLPQIADIDNEDINYFNLSMQESLRFIVDKMSTSQDDNLIKTADISYQKYGSDFDVVSFVVNASVSYAGAHPENSVETFNINLKDNTILTFGKVFNEDDVNYFNSLINEQIKDGKTAIKNTQGNDAHLFAEAEADIRNSVFYFDGDSVVFIFQQYALAPYSSGMPVFKFNKAEIKGHLQLNK